MTIAICFNCGARKFGAWQPCQHCGRKPISEQEGKLSLALSEWYMDADQRQNWSAKIGKGDIAGLDEIADQLFPDGLVAFDEVENINQALLDAANADETSVISQISCDAKQAERQAALLDETIKCSPSVRTHFMRIAIATVLSTGAWFLAIHNEIKLMGMVAAVAGLWAACEYIALSYYGFDYLERSDKGWIACYPLWSITAPLACLILVIPLGPFLNFDGFLSGITSDFPWYSFPISLIGITAGYFFMTSNAQTSLKDVTFVATGLGVVAALLGNVEFGGNSKMFLVFANCFSVGASLETARLRSARQIKSG